MKSLGQVLVESYGVPPEIIAQALAVQQEKGGKLGEILVQQKQLSPGDLLEARSRQCGLELVTRLPDDPDPFFISRVPIQYLKKFKMMPVATPRQCFIALSDPSYFQQLDDLEHLLNWDGMKAVLAPQEEIYKAINAAYDRTSQNHADQVMQDMDVEDPEAIISEIEETADLLDDTSDAPVIKLVNLMLTQAVRDNASDIHIEPYQDMVKIRHSK